MPRRNELIDLSGDIVTQTDKAILFEFDGAEFWLPKSMVEFEMDRTGAETGPATIMLPERFAIEKGLV